MSKDASLATTNATEEDIQRRVLWLCTLMIHHANNIRSNTGDLKVGGHQVSSDYS